MQSLSGVPALKSTDIARAVRPGGLEHAFRRQRPRDARVCRSRRAERATEGLEERLEDVVLIAAIAQREVDRGLEAGDERAEKLFREIDVEASRLPDAAGTLYTRYGRVTRSMCTLASASSIGTPACP